MTDNQFKDECRAWDVNEAVFGPNMWPTYQPILRKDFELFDRYVHDAMGRQGDGRQGEFIFIYLYVLI